MKSFYFVICSMISIMALSQPTLDRENAAKILELPLHCLQTEFPNKTGQTLSNEEDLGTPKELHPAFYGCFDWHSAVHGFWSMVEILKMYPDLDADDKIKNQILEQISAENIASEIRYFEREQEYSFERTYGWAWLLKLQQAADSWETPTGKTLSQNLQPLSDLLVSKYITYLPKLVYPLRVGTHNNTAFGLSFAFDYAVAAEHKELQLLISESAKRFYLEDKGCPIGWEPDGYDFFSPCMQEVDLMRKVLPKEAFQKWIDAFLPELVSNNFDWEVAVVSDRSDGHLVHLDGLNFSRAWVFYGLAGQMDGFDHLVALGDKHFLYAYPNIVGDTYEGGHWLGSFALYALLQYEALQTK